MNDRPISVVLTALESVTGRKPIRNSSGWKTQCPAHADTRPSLSIAEGDDGRVLIRCHAGCPVEAIVPALGLTLRDLMPADAPTVDHTPRRGSPRTVSSTSTPTKTPTAYPTARDAVAELESRYGPRSAWWTYHDAKGEPVGMVVRWDRPDGTKDIRPVSRTAAGWSIGGMPTPRFLYRLPELADAPHVCVVEGEKAADALRELGLVATTSPHGAKSASSAGWSALAGKECIILPDSDEPGECYAADVVRLLAKLVPRPTIKVVNLPDLPPGGDAVEYIAACHAAGLDDATIRAEIEALADAAEPIELKHPGPPIEGYQPFPVEALPEPLRSFVTKGAQAIGCDPSYIALPLLSALASAIGNSRRIQLKSGWTEPAIIWTAIVGESGTLKTPAYKLAMGPTRDLQGDALKRFAEEQAKYEAEVVRYEKALAAWKCSKADDDPPGKPQPPAAERYVVSDATVEALVPILLVNPRGLLMARDELAGWIRGFDAYKAGRGGDAQHWLSMHNGESIVVDRKTGPTPTIYVPAAAVSVTGGVQPGILDRVLGYEHRESGLLARLLLAMPSRRAKRWTEATIPKSVHAAVAAIIGALHELEPDRDDNGDPRPRIVALSSDGKAAWIEFYNEHAAEYAGLTGDLSAAWSKLEAYAARLALVVHCVRVAAGDLTLAHPDCVDEISIGAGVVLSRWFGHEARRVYSIWTESDDDRDRRQLVELIQRKGGSVTRRELMRSSRMFTTAADAEAALDELTQAGIGHWEQVPPGPKGGKPSKRFVLADTDGIDDSPRQSSVDTADVDNTPADEPRNVGSVNVNAVNDPDEAPCAGCPDGELPSDDVRFACRPGAEGMAPEHAGVENEWGEI